MPRLLKAYYLPLLLAQWNQQSDMPPKSDVAIQINKKSNFITITILTEHAKTKEKLCQ